MPTIPVRRPVLAFDKTLPPKALADIRDNLSAIVLSKHHLRLGGDEGTQIERLTASGDGNFEDHQRFDLASFLDLPVAGKSEIDIEGLDINSGHLWLVGSHSLKRKKFDQTKTDEENRKRLTKVEREPNRYTLARVPLAPGGDLSNPGAARLDSDADGSEITRALLRDNVLSPFCEVPSKENGVDVEGLAVHGERVFLGLRGPVLRGWAVLLGFDWKEASKGRLALASPLKKHLLDLGGLGIRELCIAGRDLLVLAGPTMALDGPVSVFRWAKALDQTSECIVTRKELKQVLDVPFGTGKESGCDHAEGIALMDGELMLCYDSPAPERLINAEPQKILVDVFAL